MVSIKLIRRRIRSAQNIAQITKAMEMVAASKMKKAQEEALQGKPYADKIYQMTRELASRTDKEKHPLLSPGNLRGKKLIVLLTSNKGLCGALNTNLFKFIQSVFPADEAIDFLTVGKKGQNFVVRTGSKLVADFSDSLPFQNSVPAITKLVMDGFTQRLYKEVYLTYNNFINPLKQEPVRKKILPLSGLEFGTDIGDKSKMDFLIEPSIDEVLSSLLPHYLENQVRSAINEAEASEHSSRMIAMKNASDAASDLLGDLTLILNKIRQEKITYEIADMVTARMAVE